MFPTSVTFTTKCFELVHVDIWGPYNTASLYGHRFFLTVVDDFSWATWVFFMQTKKKARELLKNFCQFVSTKFEVNIKCIRSDNGQEFKMKSFYESQGIEHQTSCVGTPQQNGVVERKHEHLLNMAKALKLQEHMPEVFWVDCIAHAVYLVNRLPSPVIGDKTPYEVLLNKRPVYGSLRVFG